MSRPPMARLKREGTASTLAGKTPEGAVRALPGSQDGEARDDRRVRLGPSFVSGSALRRWVSAVADVRQRRDVRGREYSWANAQRLQAALAAEGIAYRHFKGLAPTTELRRLQYAEDDRLGVGKRSRSRLAPEYVQRYRRRSSTASTSTRSSPRWRSAPSPPCSRIRHDGRHLLRSDRESGHGALATASHLHERVGAVGQVHAPVGRPLSFSAASAVTHRCEPCTA